MDNITVVRIINVVTTTTKKSDARRIAEALLASRLVACAQISGPIESAYLWKGKIERSLEFVLTVKTNANLLKKTESKIKSLHPYEVPEIISIPVKSAGAKYSSWLEKELGRKRKS